MAIGKAYIQQFLTSFPDHGFLRINVRLTCAHRKKERTQESEVNPQAWSSYKVAYRRQLRYWWLMCTYSRDESRDGKQWRQCPILLLVCSCLRITEWKGRTASKQYPKETGGTLHRLKRQPSDDYLESDLRMYIYVCVRHRTKASRVVVMNRLICKLMYIPSYLDSIKPWILHESINMKI